MITRLTSPTEGAAMKNMRRHYFIDKSFQSRYAAYVALTLFVVCGISILGLYFGIWGSVIESFSDDNVLQEIRTAARIQDYEHARGPEPVTSELSSVRLFREVNLLSARQREIFEDILVRTNAKFLPQAFILIILVGCASIYLTHKIAGPLYHFRKSFESVKDGDLRTRIFLRKNDEGMTVANSFNDMIKSFDQSIGNVQKALKNSSGQELKQKLEAELSKFKTSGL